VLNGAASPCRLLAVFWDISGDINQMTVFALFVRLNVGLLCTIVQMLLWIGFVPGEQCIRDTCTISYDLRVPP